MEYKGYKRIWKSGTSTCKLTLVEWNDESFTLEVSHLDRESKTWSGVSTGLSKGDAKRLRKLLQHVR